MCLLYLTVFCTAQTNTGALVIGAWGVTTDIKLERVAVRNCGGAGISVGNNVQRLEILDSAVLSVGASGIQVNTGTNVTDVLVNNSLINDTARVILGQPGGIRIKGQTFLDLSRCPSR